MSQNKCLYHIHRRGTFDELWQVGNTIVVDENFESRFWSNLTLDDYELKKYWGEDYDIDFVIATMEEMKCKNQVEEDMKEQFEITLLSYYFFRREHALEEGRKLFAPSAPKRFKSLFLSNYFNLYYWKIQVGEKHFQKFLLELDGETFTSSDLYFPSRTLTFENQVEASKEYWQPKIKKLTLCQETLFQGTAKIIK